MKKTNTNYVFTALLLIFTFEFAVADSISSLAEAVNVAGKQRMYTMRMLRNYIMIGAGLHYKDPAADLKRIIGDFEASHSALKAYMTDSSLREEMGTIDVQWQKIKAMMSQSPVQAKASEYAKNAIAFREMLNNFTNHLSKASGKTAAEAVNLAGRLRAVSQALASVYMLRAWGMPRTEKKMKTPMERFRGSLDYLNTAQETREPMKQILSKLEKTYLFFEVMNQSATMTPTLVVKKTDAMLKLADTLTNMYVKAQ
jgi:nitrate/nitrite-specific signal transduction histidine kinase